LNSSLERQISRRRFLSGAVAFGLAGAGVACGGDDDKEDDEELSPAAQRRRTSTAIARATARAEAKATPTPEATVADDEITLLDLLDAIPNTDGNRATVNLNHYGRAATAAGLKAYPPRLAPGKEVTDFARALVDAGIAPADISGFRKLSDIDSWRYEIGFSFEQIEADAYAGSSPATQQALFGAFSVADIDVAVTTDPTWSPVLTRQKYQGVEYYSWGEELKVDVRRISTVRPLGRGDRMAASGTRIFWAAKDSAMAELISVETGKSNSLTKTESFRQIAGAMEERHAHAAGLTTDANRFRLKSHPGVDAALAAKIEKESQLPPFEAIGYGAFLDKSGASYIVAIMYYQTKADAKPAATALADRIRTGTSLRTGKPWNEVFKSAFAIVPDGNLVLADIQTNTPSLWRDIFNSGDSLTLVK
jgi:hypothetical protein